MGEPYLQDNMRTLYCGDTRSMSEIPDESVQCVVTSPPYWGLRTYSGLPDMLWGGQAECAHDFNKSVPARRRRMSYDVRDPDSKQSRHRGSRTTLAPSAFCSLCGAWEGTYGGEPTPQMYVAHTIEILRELWRVLRPDGVVFWNIGDTRVNGKGTCFNPGGGADSLPAIKARKDAGVYPLDRGSIGSLRAAGLKPKDLALIPFRVAIAAQEDGWWMRQPAIWHKPNVLPESVQDRPTDAHEYVLILTKSLRYFWDNRATREPSQERSSGNLALGLGDDHRGEGIPYEPQGNGRNLRSVWTIPAAPGFGGHHAVFPERLAEICIKLSTPEVGCCAECGAPRKRVVSESTTHHKGDNKTPVRSKASRVAGLRQAAREQGGEYVDQRKTTGWQATCECGEDKVPSVVLDPFAGTGTTLSVAARLGRRARGYEMSREYCELAVERNQQGALDFVSENAQVIGRG